MRTRRIPVERKRQLEDKSDESLEEKRKEKRSIRRSPT